ncbi:MAG: Tn3 family transposase [Candidatus Accumulibacter sp. 66-26]|nr:Tn3 family transposase [Accumulibacter sp.]MBU6259252.1 Tn3 family transposase [Burkholderiales bacterium]OJW52201.1 MAG: Tn3 family transposase [Candidatus Accumulibacter sp. 66-26]
MASIERTAYPRFKRSPSARELDTLYTPTEDELQFARLIARKIQPRFGLLLLLKAFQRLGYFPAMEDIPVAIVQHVRATAGIDAEISAAYAEPRTLYRHHLAIRERLSVSAWGDEGLRVASEAMATAAEVMDNPADLINVAIEELVRQRIELPAFSTLDRLSRRIRTLVNGRFFEAVLAQLTEAERGQLDALLEVGDSPQKKSLFFALKQLPKRSSLEHLQELLDHIVKLSNTVGADHHLADIPNAKIKHFAAEAKALDAAELKKFTSPKRYVLVLSLIHRARVQARDDLADMFIKRMSHIHRRGKDELERLRIRYRHKTEHLVATLADVIQVLETQPADAEAGRSIRSLLSNRGGTQALQEDCTAINAFSGDNYFPLLWRFYRSHRPTLFRMVHLLTMTSTSEDQSLMQALDALLAHENRKGAWIDEAVDLSFSNERWKRTVLVKTDDGERISRPHFEVCVFSALAAEIKSGDVSIQGSEAYADYREQLLSWEECEPLVTDYCAQLDFAADAAGFTTSLRDSLTEIAVTVDAGFPENKSLGIDEAGLPMLKRSTPREPKASARALETALLERLPERNVIDVLCNVAHWTSWNRHFGPLSGSDPKIENHGERYILTAFTYGCNLGPMQASRHLRGAVTPHMLSFINRRHVNANKLNAALRDIINRYHGFQLPKVWGEGKSAAADGTKFDMFDQNLLAEYHIRYGGYGGIAYHHVADNYVALFSHFIPCGVWEAVYIIEGLLQNKSDIQPDTVHADTQGQSAPVFALAYLLGIKLMPRIRNWHDLVFFRPSKETTYEHIDTLFKDAIDWNLIETHWKDLVRVVLSIKAGKISSSTLLRKLGNYSRKNRLYQAFRELGRVVRTAFLLQYISDLELREQITATTNKVEAYNGFSKWLFFGGEGVIADNDPEEQEKIIKYNDLVANAIIFHNVVDQTRILRELKAEGFPIAREDVATLSPYVTSHIKRFGDYIIDAEAVPEPIDPSLPI